MDQKWPNKIQTISSLHNSRQNEGSTLEANRLVQLMYGKGCQCMWENKYKTLMTDWMSLFRVGKNSKLCSVDNSFKLKKIEFVTKKYPEWTASFEQKDQALRWQRFGHDIYWPLWQAFQLYVEAFWPVPWLCCEEGVKVYCAMYYYRGFFPSTTKQKKTTHKKFTFFGWPQTGF
jgi:hypothetical protein